jgi:pimeloyl-ACP methyl ester carboxylesterase
VAALEALAERRVTPCGGGGMVWRRWGAGPDLVLLHGASGSWTHWIRNVEPLARRFRVAAPDMPGFGDSDLPPGPHTAERLAGLVAAGIEALYRGPIDLAGFSFGGIIAGLVAARLGSRVRTLVLVGPNGMALPFAPTRPLRRVAADMAPREAEEAHRENLRILMLGDPAAADDLAVALQADNVRRARFRSAAIPASDVLLRALPGVRARITGIWGERDAFAAPYVDERRRVLARFAPGLDFRVVEGAGHWVIYEAALRVNAILAEMLAA